MTMNTSSIFENFTSDPTVQPINNTNTTYEYVLPFTNGWVIASTVILAIFFIFGVSANSITVAVIRSSPKLRNRYYVILCSLCVSDIMSSFISILFLYRRTWGFLYFAWPDFFCRLYWGMDLWTSFATALHILSFAILRLIGVRWPTKFKQITNRHMALWIFGIWFSTFSGGFIPHFIFNTAKVIDRNNQPDQARWASCSLAWDWIPVWQVYVQFAYAIFLFIPALSIIGISIAISKILKKQVPPGFQSSSAFTSVSGTIENLNVKSVTSVVCSPSRTSSTAGQTSATSTPVLRSKECLYTSRQNALQKRCRKNKQAITQLFLIVGCFFFGYIPLTAFHFFTGFTIKAFDATTNAIDWRFAMIQYIMLRFSECLNPVFYNLSSGRMRRETKLMLRKTFGISSKQKQATNNKLKYVKSSTEG